MSNIVFSDSQESALFSEDVYNDLQNEIDIPNINPMMLEDLEDRKFDTGSLCQYTQEPLLDRKYIEPKTPVPIKDEFPGEFNFELILPNTQGKHWMFSQILGKVFINMEQTLPLQFKWDPPIPNLYLRTAMVFSLDQYRSDPVQRCHNHKASTNATDKDSEILKHVVRCTDVESIYEERKGHLSVVTPLRSPQAGSQYVPMYFQFLCKNSCPSGMNRRPTELIFTLEDLHNNEVLGRRRLGIRVCSCPKRDKEKEEMDSLNITPGAKKRKINGQPPPPLPPGKKLMNTNPNLDTQIYNVNFNVVGRDNYQAILKYGYDLMAGQALRNDQISLMQPYLNDILQKSPL